MDSARPVRPVPWDVAAVVAAGGAVGGTMRHAVGLLLPAVPGRFPWATLVENVSGSLLLGALVVYVVDVWPPSRYARPFLGVGVLGGYTTFSTATNDVRAMLQQGAAGLASVYLVGTLVGCLLATWTGLGLARWASRDGRERP